MVSHKVRLKPISSATDKSSKTRILVVACFDMILSKEQTQKIGFMVSKPIYDANVQKKNTLNQYGNNLNQCGTRRVLLLLCTVVAINLPHCLYYYKYISAHTSRHS